MTAAADTDTPLPSQPLKGIATDRLSVGQGTAPAELAVEQVLEALAPGKLGGASYQRLAAGITNLNWLADVGGRTYFLKLYGAKTDSFIDRASASAASRLAGELGVGPKLVAHFPDPGAEVYEYLDGFRNFVAEDLNDPLVRQNLMAAYRTMHEAAPLTVTRTGFEQLSQRLVLARSTGAVVPDDLDEMLGKCALAETAVLAAGMKLGVCHNDSYAANFMVDDARRVRVIDWEYAANNDRLWDLSMIALSSAVANGPKVWSEIYLGRPSPEAVARIEVYGGVMGVSWGLWAAMQAQISAIGFDFAAYSKLLFGMARERLASAVWQEALTRL